MDTAFSWDFTLANYDAVWAFLVQLGLLLLFLMLGNILRRTIPLFRKCLIPSALLGGGLLLGAIFMATDYTTSPINLTDGFERLLSPLKKVGVPVHEFAMMMTIALRFVPLLLEETDKIMAAQKARGADFESGGIAKRIKAIIPILIPLLVSSFRRADELADAMDARCYSGSKGRTKYKKQRRFRIYKSSNIQFVQYIF